MWVNLADLCQSRRENCTFSVQHWRIVRAVSRSDFVSGLQGRLNDWILGFIFIFKCVLDFLRLSRKKDHCERVINWNPLVLDYCPQWSCGKVIFWQACVKNSVHRVHGRGVCMAGGVCDRGHVWQGVCMSGGWCAWQGECIAGGMHGRGCVAGGMCGRGVCVAGGACMAGGEGVCMARGCAWQGMHSCF